MLNLRHPPSDTWPVDLRRRGEGDHWPEEFGPWWERHGAALGHLDPRIAEQWVYRHFDGTWFKFIPLATLQWRLEMWTSDDILSHVHLERDELNPVHDFQAFNENGVSTALDFNAHGTWSYPPVLLETPCGVISWDHGDLPEVRFVAVEGHKRLRYHAAVRHAGRKARNHQVFILASDVTDPLPTP